ncbi:2-dehydro-3-deoxygalactonokinase [Peristeroidobacter soli]|uniref:2-dehydro-3-deoxygalactonokinase n=1 Tax=Peristeroidobacter soli TaxID=2497877 RepID=UPI00101C3019|nr:2-dehydro-3-deoxygalactonokinase [Peristeroidobacter soli]
MNHAVRIGIAWGTRALHAYLISGSGVILERQSRDVTLQTSSRMELAQLLNDIVANWPAAHGPIWLCGMIGSDVGWTEVPALETPVSYDQLAAAAVSIDIGKHACRIVPGLTGRSVFGDPERLRGEEILIAGWMQRSERPREAIVLCVPGMHGKWVHVSGDCIVQFHTAATVELFGLLRNHSFLRGELANDSICEASFLAGVDRAAQGGSLARLLFSVRSLRLSKELMPEQTTSYAWGLLIGADLAEGLRAYRNVLESSPLVITGAHQTSSLFARAARHLGAQAMEEDERTLTAAGFSAAWRLNEVDVASDARR